MVTLNWMMFTGMTLMLLAGLITRSVVIVIMAAIFSIPLVINAQENLERTMWAGVGVVITVIAISFAMKNRKASDDY